MRILKNDQIGRILIVDEKQNELSIVIKICQFIPLFLKNK